MPRHSIVAVFLLASFTVAGLAQSGSAAGQVPASVSSNQHLRDGMLAYRAGDFKKAVPQLKAALEELKADPGFETSLMWRVLVDNLGMAYGISGDLKNAKSTFDYGVSKDPTYPMFHYNLACTFAEMSDRDKAIEELKQAFVLKAHANPGEPMPNPVTDDSFARFLKDKTFLAALDDIRKGGRLYPDRLDFSAPSAPWRLTIPAGDFEISQTQESPDGRQSYFMFASDKTGLVGSIYVEPATQCADAKACRDMVRTSNLTRVTGPENVSSAEISGVSVFEYFLPSFQGHPVRQQNLYAEFVQDGYWADVHLSKTQYVPADHKLFEDFLRGVVIETKK